MLFDLITFFEETRKDNEDEIQRIQRKLDNLTDRSNGMLELQLHTWDQNKVFPSSFSCNYIIFMTLFTPMSIREKIHPLCLIAVCRERC